MLCAFWQSFRLSCMIPSLFELSALLIQSFTLQSIIIRCEEIYSCQVLIFWAIENWLSAFSLIGILGISTVSSILLSIDDLTSKCHFLSLAFLLYLCFEAVQKSRAHEFIPNLHPEPSQDYCILYSVFRTPYHHSVRLQSRRGKEGGSRVTPCWADILQTRALTAGFPHGSFVPPLSFPVFRSVREADRLPSRVSI